MGVNLSYISIVIPALNESEAIESVVKGIVDNFPDVEVIVVNDGSTDNTAELAENAGAKVISHQHRRGYGASLRTGTEKAKGEYVLFCDGDGQHRLEDIASLIDECGNYDMVVGKRGADSHAPIIRRPGKFILKHFANYLAGEKIPDLNSGLRIFKREILLKYMHLMPTGFSFSTTSTFAIMKSGHPFKYIPITVKKRVGVSTVKQWRHGPQTLMLMLRLTVLFEPLKVFLTIAGGLFLLDIVSLVIDLTIGSKGIGDTTVLLAISSLLVFMFGLLCDQVSAMRREYHQ